MRYMMTYDLMETLRNTNQWLGQSALSLASYPIFSMAPNPAFPMDGRLGRGDRKNLSAHGDQTRLVGIDSFTCSDGKDHLVSVETVVERPVRGSRSF